MLSRSDLYSYQNRAVEFIKERDRCALWVDMGLGKTVAALTAFADAHESLDARRMLVVAPKRVARDVWDAELETWAHLQGLTVSKILGGSPSARLKGLRVPADIHTINRENLSWLFSGYVQEVAKHRFRQVRHWPWDWLVLDESQSFKNPSAHRTIAASRISTFGLVDKIIELSGTPAPRSYEDLWSQFFIMDHGERLGADLNAFLKKYFLPPPNHGYKWLIKEGAREEIHERLQDIVLAMRAEDYLDLPPVIENPIYINLPDRIKDKYKKLERTSVLDLAGHTITAQNAGVLGSKLLQLASGAMYVDDRGNYETLHDLKLDALCDALEGLTFSGPVLVGYGFVSDAQRIERRLRRFCGKALRWARLGSERSLRAFQAGDTDIGVIHPGSGGHGLNSLHLSGAENLIWFGPTNNLELWDQLNGRIAGGHRRMGKNVTIHVLLARDTVDEAYMAGLKAKDLDQTGLVRALVKGAR